MAEYGDVRLKELQDFQSDILKLSNVLEQYYGVSYPHNEDDWTKLEG